MDENLRIIIDNKNKAQNEVNKNVIVECEYGWKPMNHQW